LDDLGPTFVKFGQLLSTRSDIIPESILSELQKLQDTATPISLEVAQAVMEGELGVPVGKLFAEFDPVWLGSASIGQVYRARLHGGDLVAVKVQRPEAAGRFAEFLRLMMDLEALFVARFWDRIFFEFK
jgi:ubiquinone biosynthesis protein